MGFRVKNRQSQYAVPVPAEESEGHIGIFEFTILLEMVEEGLCPMFRKELVKLDRTLRGSATNHPNIADSVDGVTLDYC